MNAANAKSAAFGFLGAAAFWTVAHSAPAVAQSAKEFMVQLQPTTPGFTQAGHVHVSGKVMAGELQGDGTAVIGVDAAKLGGNASSAYGQVGATNNWSGVNNFSNPSSSFAGSGTLLTGLSASSLASGTVPDARLAVGGDLTGPLSSAKLSKLQGKVVTVSFPTAGEVLGYDGTSWKNLNDGLTLPYDVTTDIGNPFKISTTGGNGMIVASVSGSTGIVGASGSVATVGGTGVVGTSTVLGGVGVFGWARQSATTGGIFRGSGLEVRLASPYGAIWMDGFLRREYVAGSPSVAVPIAHGSVSSTGTVLGGTGNFAVVKAATGQYDVTVDGETYSNNTFTVTVTPVSNSDRHACVADPGAPFRVNVFNQAGTPTDTAFQFTVWTADPATSG